MFNLDFLFITSMIGSVVQAAKEAFEPTMTMEDWANTDLYYDDLMNGVPMEQCVRNLRNGKYRTENRYPAPHRDTDGKIIIENSLLYEADLERYSPLQVDKWINQGKYNLDEEGLKKEEERIMKEYERLLSI